MNLFDRSAWPHQIFANKAVHDAESDGHRRILVTSPTGGGKARIMCELIRDWLTAGLKVGVYTNRKMLIEQLSKVMNSVGLWHGTRTAAALGPGEMPSDCPLQISSIQTEHSRVIKKKTWQLHDADRVLVDECFVAGTVIMCPSGQNNIENMRPGDKVYCAAGIGTVEAVSCRPASDLYRLEFCDGAILVCTGTHRIFTESGWAEARALVLGSFAFGPEAVRFLWENIHSQKEEKGREGVGDERSRMGQAAVLLSILREEIEESDEQPSGKAKDEGQAARNKAQASEERRERAITALAAACPPARIGGRMGIGSGRADKDGPCFNLSDLLQTRSGEQGKDDRDRDRRELAHGSGEAGAGRKENGYAGIARVVGVSRIEQGSPAPVFNLRVSGHPSYFANGKLVHNCHLNKSPMAAGLLNKHLEAGAAIVGLTATPFELGHMFDHLIVAGTNSELRDCGALVPALHYGPDEPDCSKIKKQPWEYSENDVRKVMKVQNIIGRMSEWYGKLNPQQKPTLLFAPGVAESLWCAQQFSAKGIPSAHIDGETCWLNGKEVASCQQVRDDIRGMSRDGTIKIVCNRFVLREGIDFPWIEHLILSTVFGALQSYIQSVGRGLRASPETGKTSCCLQDHGGNWHRHGSANMDRQWSLDMTESMAQNAREEAIIDGVAPEPVVCFRCGKVMLSRKCSCGYEITKKTRPVIGDDGILRQHEGDIFPKRKIKHGYEAERIWEQCYYRAKNSKNGMTFNQAEALCFIENGFYPHRNMPLMPTNPLDWSRRVKDVPKERLIPKPKESANAY